MTDKQIIIDGVKTSKKDFIDNFSIELTNRNIFEREQIGDKYFEIILAKEQECEAYKMEVEEGKEINAELKAENEDLKKSILQECPNCGEEYLNYKGVELYYEIDDLKQTLTEIKEIAKHFTKKGLEPQSVEHQLKLRGKEELAKIILQKCEVIEDE